MHLHYNNRFLYYSCIMINILDGCCRKARLTLKGLHLLSKMKVNLPCTLFLPWHTGQRFNEVHIDRHSFVYRKCQQHIWIVSRLQQVIHVLLLLAAIGSYFYHMHLLL